MNDFEFSWAWQSVVLFCMFCVFIFTCLFFAANLFYSWRARKRVPVNQLINSTIASQRSLNKEIDENVALVSNFGPTNKKSLFRSLLSSERVIWGHAWCVIFLLICGLTHPEIIWPMLLGLIILCSSWIGFWIKISRRQRHTTLFLHQMPDAIDIIVRGARVGNSISKNIATVGLEMPAPIGPVFQQTAHRLNIGMDLETAFLVIPGVHKSKELQFLATTLALQKETGGEYGETLENLSRVLRERRTYSLKTVAVTAEGRLSAKIVSAMSIAVIFLLAFTNKAQLDFLLYDQEGHSLLIYCILSTVVGLFFVSRIVIAVSK
jgi:Flp pilus assembly protein TadB